MQYFEFKKKPSDFFVEEVLDKTLSGKGSFLYILFEKNNKNTDDIIYHIMKRFNIKRKDIGLGGIKDKFGITRQWICIHKDKFKDYKTWKYAFPNAVQQKAKIIEKNFDYRFLKAGDIQGNKFNIILRPLEINIYNNKEAIINSIEKLKTDGAPNYFGNQRFGKNNHNPEIGKTILEGKKDIKNLGKYPELEKKFKIQSFSSFLFNQYIDKRNKLGYTNKPLEGDIIKNIKTQENKIYNKKLPKGYKITGPFFGYDILLSESYEIQNNKVKITKSNKSFELERQILLDNGFDLDILEVFKKHGIFGIRRFLRVYPNNIKYNITKEKNLQISFELPSGCYASEIINHLINLISKTI